MGGPYKIIALDMDGTLLSSNHQISEGNRRAIEEARNHGVHVILSTGRSFMTSKEYMESLALDSYHITVNGSEIWHTSGELIERQMLHGQHIETMWKLKEQHNTTFWAVSTEKVWRGEFPENIHEHEWLKFGYDVPNQEIREQIEKELQAHSELEVTNSSPKNLEINAMGVSKAKALATVCERLGLTMANVLAMGDSLNDLAMIEEAGCGVAMGNAQEIVKEAADWVTGTNDEDGVAQAIRKFVLDNS